MLHSNQRSRSAPPAGGQVLVALLGATLVAALVVVAVLLTADPRRAGTNGRLLALPVNVKPGGSFCQPDEVLPKDSAALALTVNTGAPDRQGGPLEVEVRPPGAAPLTGRVPGGYVTQVVTIVLAPRAPPQKDVYGVEVCVRNRGKVPVAMFGDRTFGGEKPARIRGGTKDAPARARMEWYRTGEESWFAVAPVIGERFALFKASFFGPWTLPALGFLALLTFLATGLFLVRTLRP